MKTAIYTPDPSWKRQSTHSALQTDEYCHGATRAQHKEVHFSISNTAETAKLED